MRTMSNFRTWTFALSAIFMMGCTTTNPRNEAAASSSVKGVCSNITGRYSNKVSFSDPANPPGPIANIVRLENGVVPVRGDPPWRETTLMRLISYAGSYTSEDPDFIEIIEGSNSPYEVRAWKNGSISLNSKLPRTQSWKVSCSDDQVTFSVELSAFGEGARISSGTQMTLKKTRQGGLEVVRKTFSGQSIVVVPISAHSSEWKFRFDQHM